MLGINTQKRKEMKTSFKNIFAALLLVAAVSCAKQVAETTPTEPAAPADGAVTFKIKADCAGEFEYDGVKSTIDATYKPLWQVGDAIAVNNGTVWATSEALTADDIQNGGKTATFTVTIPEAAGYTLVFPASSADTETSVSEGKVSIVIPGVQTIPAGGCVAPNALVQVGTTTDLTQPISFRNATSLLRFTAPADGITSIKFSDKAAAAPVCGAAEFDTTLGTVSAGTEVNVLEVASTAGFTKGEVYYASVVPGTLANGFKFYFKTENAKAALTSSKEAVFAQNGGINFTLPEDKLIWVPYVISTREDMYLFRDHADAFESGEWVKLGADIELEFDTVEWKPVRNFIGNFDGQNHCIYNIYASSNSTDGVGFFGKLPSACTIRNLKLGVDPATGNSDGKSYIAVTGKKNDNFYAGGLVGIVKQNGGEFLIENVTTAYDNGENGVLGKCKAETTTSDETVTTSFRIGGIVGVCGEGTKLTIRNCTNKSFVRAAPNSAKSGDPHTSQYVGGIIGLTTGNNLTIENCTNEGKVQLWNSYTLSASSFAAGILARMGKNTTGHVIRGCVNKGEVLLPNNMKSDVYLSGILACDNAGAGVVIDDCTNEGTIHIGPLSGGSSYLSGICSYLQAGTIITGCTNKGEIYKTENNNSMIAFGGIVGRAVKVDGARIEGCANEGEIYSSKHNNTGANNKCFGGILGLGDIDIKDCSNTGKIHFDACTNSGPSAYCGGIIGVFAGITTKNVMSAATSSITGCTCASAQIDATCPLGAAGGLIGYVFDSEISTCTGCSVNATVTATADKGIVIGAFSGAENASVWGSDSSKIGVAGSVGGTTLDASNYTNYLWGANGTNATFHAQLSI